MNKNQTPFNEDLFTVSTRLGELGRLLIIIAEDTEERADSKEDVIRNMGALRVIEDELSRLEKVCERWDDMRVHCPDKLINVL